ncbi:pseudaminic acid cytidylyltransferase [Kluyvera ascorbata]|uniref:pseudaminic acid cytidylyltransferase n=1 Tax=Kluyvera ascorbata TaxID=51288 RepID=UPI00374D616B
MNVAIIPARGGSKRIPRKNIKEFCGKPMIAWSIEAACKSGVFDRIIVSTDDEEIANISVNYGAEVPFIRPENLADDFSGTNAVIKHAIEELESQGNKIDLVCCIYATAPFIQVEDILQGYKNLIENEDVYFSFPVCEFPYPVQRALKLTHSGRIEMFQPEHFSSRSQDLENAYHDTGQFYWGRRDAYLKKFVTFKEYSIPIIIPRKRVIDLDTMEDWELAVIMSKYLFSGE